MFAAIVEVLGDAVTAEVASAWDEVYWHMAGALVTVEKRLYADTGVADGDVWRTLVLRRRLQESPDTVSFVLGAADRSALPQARPGQYVSVQVTARSFRPARCRTSCITVFSRATRSRSRLRSATWLSRTQASLWF